MLSIDYDVKNFHVDYGGVVDNDNDNDDYDHDDDHDQYHDHESIVANLDRLNSTVNTTAAVKGRGVDRALWGGLILILAFDSSRIMIVDMIYLVLKKLRSCGNLSAQSDVAVLTPGGAPRVLDLRKVDSEEHVAVLQHIRISFCFEKY